MSNERRLRLHQVARELKVGQTTIIEFLEKKGIKVDNSPSSIIEPAAYAILDKEFGGNKHIEKVNIREKINLKHESVSLDDRKENEQNGSDDGADFKNEVIIKSGVINVKDEVARMATPKILGKIDLSDNHKKKNTAEPATEKKPEAPKAAPIATPVKKQEAPKPAVEPVVSAPAAPATPAAAAPVAASVPHAAPAAAPKPSETVAETTADKTEVVIQNQTYDQRMAADESNLFRPGEGTKLSGPKVLGKIDVKSFEKKKGEDSHRKREKRKRISKDKVDITQKQNQPTGKDNRPKAAPNGAPGAAGSGKSAFKDRRKGKAVKPVVKAEVSEEEVQKQIKDTGTGADGQW